MGGWIRSATFRATLLYTGLSLVLTYPLPFHFTRRILGDGDVWLFVWNMWWMRHAFWNGLNPFCTDYIHFPVGTCIFLHTWVYPATIASVPLQALFSPITLYNTFALSSFILAGVGMFRLARYVGTGDAGALLAGIAFSFSPYHFAHALGHLNLISYQWIPFFLHSLLLGLDEGWTRSRILASAGWLILVGLTDWYYLLYCCMALGLILVARSRHGRSEFRKALWGSLVVLFLSLAVLSPLIAGMAWQMSGGLPPERVSQIYSADLQSFFLPGPISTFSRGFERWHSQWSAGASEIGTFIPWSVLALAILGVRGIARKHRSWVVLWVPVFFILSLGPYLHVGGTVYDRILLPYGWIESIPGLDIMRAPIRFHIMTYLGVCLAYGAGVTLLVRKGGSVMIAGLLGGFVAVESLSAPLMTAGEDVSPFYRQLAREPRPESLIDLHYSSRALFYQTIHQHKILGRYAMLSREPGYTHAFLRETPIVRELTAENQIHFATNGWPREALAAASERVRGPITAMAAGRSPRGGFLEVESAEHFQLWTDGARVDPPGSPVLIRPSPPGEAGSLVVLRLFTDGEGMKDPSLVRLTLDGVDLSAEAGATDEILPVTEIAFSSRTGFTWVFYPRAPVSQVNPVTALSDLRRLGFGWLVVPFYGNDHFIREGLGLEPVYEDVWLQAYRLHPD